MHLRLKVVKGKPHGHCLTFPGGEFMFGRGPECDVRPNSDLVSRQHCILHVANDAITIRDLGSMNGTLVNGQLVIGARRLSHGDTLQIGPLVLEVLLDSPPDTLALMADTVRGSAREMGTSAEPGSEDGSTEMETAGGKIGANR
jgi:pSer/pThr/pTyr-binding forkhead associated (FHA) protein